MPAEPPSQPDSKDRNRPVPADSAKEATESDLWNLDDEPLERPAPRPRESPVAPRPAVSSEDPGAEAGRKAVQRGKTPARNEDRKTPLAPVEPLPTRDEIGELEEDPEEAEQEAKLIVLPDEEEEEPAPPPQPAEEPYEESEEEEDEEEDTSAEEAAPRQNRPRSEVPVPAAPAVPLQLPKLQPRELLGIAAVAFVLLLGAIWVVSRFFTQVTIESPHAQAPDYPVKGSHATVANAESYWRAPIREGANAEKIKREAMMIPVVEVSLDSAASSQGALRLEFHNDRGEKVGDVITRGFQGGRFQASGDATLMIPATDGFASEGEFNAYLTSDAPPWTVEIREGASIDGSSASFKPLAIVPIKRARR